MEMWKFLSENNEIHLSFKKFEENFPSEFKLTGITRCGHCNGTGLNPENKQTACLKCMSVGYMGFKSIKEETICPDCNSTGRKVELNHVADCKTCLGSGRLDWVDAVKRGIRLDKIW